MMLEPTVVAIVEDDARVREGVRQLIDAEADSVWHFRQWSNR